MTRNTEIRFANNSWKPVQGHGKIDVLYNYLRDFAKQSHGVAWLPVISKMFCSIIIIKTSKWEVQ